MMEGGFKYGGLSCYVGRWCFCESAAADRHVSKIVYLFISAIIYLLYLCTLLFSVVTGTCSSVGHIQ